jgi:predicted dienelactone hydrolase
VLLSHGTGGAAAQLSWLAEELATRGFIVAAVNHHGNTAAEPSYQPQGFVLWWERARDLSVALDSLLEDPVFAGRIDQLRIGAGGFSLGGYTVLALAGARVDIHQMEEYCASHHADPSCDVPPEAPFTLQDIRRLAESDSNFQQSMARHSASYADIRVRAFYAIAPGVGPALVVSTLASIGSPTRIVVGDADRQAVPATNALPIAAAIPGAEVWVVPGVAHYTFLARCGLLGRVLARQLCEDPPSVRRESVHRLIAEDAVRFFSRALGAA